MQVRITYLLIKFICLRRRCFFKFSASCRFRETTNFALGYFKCFFKYLREILILIGVFCFQLVLCLGTINGLCFTHPGILCERGWRILHIGGLMSRLSVLTLLITSLQLETPQFDRRPTIVQSIAEIANMV